MTVGQNIRKKRNDNNFTQKELAEKLSVTPQAISRWEADEVEPSIDTLKSMATIFECSVDELLGMEVEKNAPEPQVVEVEKVVYQEPQKALGICAKCGKIIYEAKDLLKVQYEERVRIGRGSRLETKSMILCESCNDKRDAEIKRHQKGLYRRRYRGARAQGDRFELSRERIRGDPRSFRLR